MAIRKTKDIQRIATLDSALVEIIKDFLLLRPLSWPEEVQEKFLKNADRGNLVMPEISYPSMEFEEKIKELDVFLKTLGKDDHPAIVYLRDTAESYKDAYQILQGAGTQHVSEFSRKLYGRPKDVMPGYARRTNLDVAKYFLRIVDTYQVTIADDPLIYNAEEFRDELVKRVTTAIDSKTDPISITVDDTISARASAGSSYVKIRKGAMFSANDIKQLFHHEVMTHTLTYINGRAQPILKTLGHNAPRTTATQEGLAMFSEYMNLSVDLVRLRRIALRIVAIDMAERGANFIDLFRFFGENGQNNEESYLSAMRIFRGGVAKGGIIFYKDNVYLKGLMEVNSFLKQATHQGEIHDIALLFCGKLTTQDVQNFKLLAENGHIADPVYMPDWAQRNGELAAHLAFNDLTERFRYNNARSKEKQT